MQQPLGTYHIRDTPDQLANNKYYKKGLRAAQDGAKRDTNPYKLDPEIWEKLRKRTYWFMGFEDFYYSAKRQALDKKIEKEERRREKEKRKHKKDKERKRRKRSKERHRKHRHEHKH